MKGVSRVTEQELVSAAKAGDQQAFEQLVQDNQNRIYSLAVRLAGDREEAFDLAQEAFVKAWQGLPAFQGESSFATWIYRLATNVCIDYLRKQKRRRQVESEVSLDDEELSWTEPADWSQDPHRQLERSEQGRALARGLEALPEQQRQIRTQLALALEGVVSQQLLAAEGGTLIPAFEVMTVTPAVRNMIRESKAFQLDSVISTSGALGLITMDQSILELVRGGRGSRDTALRHASNPDWLEKRLSSL